MDKRRGAVSAGNGGGPDRPGPRRFELAPQVRVRTYTREVGEILAALGHPEALVTDETTLGDFFGAFAEDDEAAVVAATLARLLGRGVAPEDVLADLAEALHRGRRGGAT
jgi:hypothetical protein